MFFPYIPSIVLCAYSFFSAENLPPEFQLSAIALKLAPVHPTQWPDWILASVTYFSGRGSPTEHILDFLSIAAEEVDTADLLGSNK
jgi:hypothetical protein